jgi:hypothetical protein
MLAAIRVAVVGGGAKRGPDLVGRGGQLVPPAKTLLLDTSLSNQEIAVPVGYHAHTALSRAFLRRQGMNPGAWRALVHDGTTHRVAGCTRSTEPADVSPECGSSLRVGTVSSSVGTVPIEPDHGIALEIVGCHLNSKLLSFPDTR